MKSYCTNNWAQEYIEGQYVENKQSNKLTGTAESNIKLSALLIFS